MTVSPLVATYRIQLTPAFGFDAVAEIVPDLARLGISHLYLSPVAEAVTGSTHGYDVVDPTIVRAALGGRDALYRLARRAAGHGMGIVVDIVPNHVSTAEPQRNTWWWTVLRDGPDAPCAGWFDIDWQHGDGRVIVPALGGDLADVVADGELVVDGDVLRYHDQRFPLRSDASARGEGVPDVAELAQRQHYRLQHWRRPDRNVRRFFMIDDLVAIRPEAPEVADAVHAIVADLAAHGWLDGVRVDHVDGLADPAAYLTALRAAVGESCWVAVEKIVVGDERLPPHWPIEGTTGYEWISTVDHLFTHPSGAAPLTGLWQEFGGDLLAYDEHERDGVRAVLAGELRPDLERVARAALDELPGEDPADLCAALTELTVELGRYRTYLTPGRGDTEDPARAAEVSVVGRAAAGAARRLDDRRRETLAALVDTILAGGETTVRWQQLSGPALAKGGEDRALYRSLRLAAHNEVGGDPGRWDLPLDAFHERNIEIARRWPATLLAASTHDTKRSEDVRSRLLVLSELGDRWVSLTHGWRELLDEDAPTGAALLLALQTAVGAWPIDAGRLGDYLVKAAREAALDTSWVGPDLDHEAALLRLAEALTTAPLAEEIERFVIEIDPAARQIALAQLVLRCTAPGVPDVFQGGESWLHTLVDPDNRRPLDVARLREAVDTLGDGPVWDSPHVKPAVLGRALAVRRRHADAFGPGSGYTPMTATGPYANHVIAFARTAPADNAGAGEPDADTVVTVAARFPCSRGDGWLDTALELPAGGWRDALDDDDHPFRGSVGLADLLGDRPAALIIRNC